MTEYWTTCELLETPFFPKCMSRNRYQLIKSFFHVRDRNDALPDRMYRVRPVLDYLLAKLSKGSSVNTIGDKLR